MPTNIRDFNWDKIWESCDPEPVTIEDILFRLTNGHWVAVFAVPNSFEVMEVLISFNPFTGERLE
jgi:hypothetical protein